MLSARAASSWSRLPSAPSAWASRSQPLPSSLLVKVYRFRMVAASPGCPPCSKALAPVQLAVPDWCAALRAFLRRLMASLVFFCPRSISVARSRYQAFCGSALSSGCSVLRAWSKLLLSIASRARPYWAACCWRILPYPQAFSRSVPSLLSPLVYIPRVRAFAR